VASLLIVHKALRDDSMPDFALSIVLGIALAAATGFRVFLPMLIVSGAAYTGHLSLDETWLDALATRAALIAGTIVSAAVMTDVPVKWTAAVIAGGGIDAAPEGRILLIIEAWDTGAYRDVREIWERAELLAGEDKFKLS
jgi:hypothetical protein